MWKQALELRCVWSVYAQWKGRTEGGRSVTNVGLYNTGFAGQGWQELC